MTNPYDNRYENPCYWGEKPTTVTLKFIEFLPLLRTTFPDNLIRILDLGCGDGRDAISLAQHGLEVTGIDISAIGLNRLKAKAAEASLQSRVLSIQSDLTLYEPQDNYHAIISSGALHYATPETRPEVIERYKRHVPMGGLFAATVIVENPNIPPAPDAESNVRLFRSGEIASYFWDWEVLWLKEEVKECRSTGIPHHHAFERIIARKIVD